jgi:hypothetical protein
MLNLRYINYFIKILVLFNRKVNEWDATRFYKLKGLNKKQ